jgi:predicted GIY-YIG superfamily endonuclease
MAAETTQNHYCYILYNPDTNATYNGYTVNLERRLRQHNGELKGGAKATRRHANWRFLAVVSCDTFTKHTALSCEWHIRYPTCRRPRPKEYGGAMGRLRSLPLVFRHDKFEDMRFELWIHPDFMGSCAFEVEGAFGENVRVVALRSWSQNSHQDQDAQRREGVRTVCHLLGERSVEMVDVRPEHQVPSG